MSAVLARVRPADRVGSRRQPLRAPHRAAHANRAARSPTYPRTGSSRVRPDLLPFREQQLAFERTQSVDEKNPIQVIDFVLENPRQQALRFNPQWLALRIVPLDDDRMRALDYILECRNAETAFLAAFTVLADF